MILPKGHHLAYCTNIHRGETWTETFESLDRFTLAVRDAVSPAQPYAIGLRLSDQAARDLSEPETLLKFRRWLDRNQCYVFTINGFPYGRFHGTRVKEQVYAPDWRTAERLEYTNRLFALLAHLLPEGVEGSVSTVPCSFKEFIRSPADEKLMRDNLWKCVERIHELSERTGKVLHLGLEPEPLCHLETSEETVAFFNRMREERPNDERIQTCLGVNYDTCHLAVEFEEAGTVLQRFREQGIKISKIHLSSALKVVPTEDVRAALGAFVDPVYFHQVVARREDGNLRRYRDLDVALEMAGRGECAGDCEWRIHFHIPLHSEPTAFFGNTADHILGVMDALKKHPEICSHLEMETYTWDVLPIEMKGRDVVEDLVREYKWSLARLSERQLA